MKTLGLMRVTGMVACALILASMSMWAVAMPAAGQGPVGSMRPLDLRLGQDANRAQSQQATQDPVVTPTPVVGSTSGQVQSPPEDASPEPETQEAPTTNAAQTAAPAATSDSDLSVPVLAQGLIYLTGDAVIWQVREVELSESSTVTGNARVILQRSGTSVVRNDVTGKRARLEPGEAYFASADDPYTITEESGTSVVWIFEISNNNTVGEGAFYLSPDVTGYGEAVYDYEFARNVIGTGETAEFEGGSGPSLLMVLSGEVNVTGGGSTASLSARDGLIVDAGATIEGPNSGEAVYVTMTVGPEVGDIPAGAPEPVEDDAEPAEPDEPAQDSAATDSTTSAETTEPAAPAETSQETGGFVTSIQVGAVESIGVTMYADGELVFDGWLAPGEWTAFYTGSEFEVYTTSGVNTLFNNSCGGDAFQMGFEPGEAYYVLSATAESCAPVD